MIKSFSVFVIGSFVGSSVRGYQYLKLTSLLKSRTFQSFATNDNVIANATKVYGSTEIVRNCTQVLYDKLGVSENTDLRAQFYIPLFLYFQSLLTSLTSKGPLLIGISAPQVFSLLIRLDISSSYIAGMRQNHTN